MRRATLVVVEHHVREDLVDRRVERAGDEGCGRKADSSLALVGALLHLHDRVDRDLGEVRKLCDCQSTLFAQTSYFSQYSSRLID